MAATLCIRPSYGEGQSPRDLNMRVIKNFVEQELEMEIIYMKRYVNGDIIVKLDGLPMTAYLYQKHELNNVPVRMYLPKGLNFISGRIYHPELSYLTEEDTKELITGEILYSVKKHPDANFAEISWLLRDRQELPDVVRLGWDWVKVRPTVKKPVRCYRCQKYGHTAANCLKTPVCAVCAGEHEPIQDCNNQQKCPACGGPHTAYDPQCPAWREEFEISKIKQQDKISYSAAVKKRQEQKQEEQQEENTEETEDDNEDNSEEEGEEEDIDVEEEDNTARSQLKRKQEQEEHEQEETQTTEEQPKTTKEQDKSVLPATTPGGWQKATSRKKKK